MPNADSVPRSIGTSPNLPANPADRQAAERAAYIDSVLADWPPLTPQQQNTIGSLLGNGAPQISTGDYISLEMKRYIEATETPGKYGTYGDEVAA